MVTVKGVVRSYGTAVRQIEREQQRRARETAKAFKEQQKQKEISNATSAVREWTQYVEMIKSLHKDCTEPIDWTKIKEMKEPVEPIRNSNTENQIQNKIDNFKPSFFDKIFGLTRKKLTNLENQLIQAKNNNQKNYELKHSKYLEELNNWGILQEIVKVIEHKESEAYKKAFEFFEPFSEIGELGAKISFKFENNHIDVDIFVNSEEAIPNYELKQTSTGKLSRKDMSKSKFNELYQDHICSSVIRIAREVFAYVPVEYSKINAVSNLLNSATGHMEKQSILSVIILPETLNKLNLDTIDPSDSMKNFVHNMKFNKTSGFSIVEKVELKK
ncbi:MAG: hypothetical protein GQ564_04735 [Bacteroidales bacterium]|nr:hypothetical protein [Bacteroidales bacterium]